MSIAILPTTHVEAAEARVAYPGAVVVAGGTDLMVEVNDGRRRVDRWIGLGRVADANAIDRDGTSLCLAAGVTFEQVLARHTSMPPALAQAARTIGGPQVRAAATIGGNLATASPAGDSLPALACCDAVVELVGARGSRLVELGDFLVGPKRTGLRDDEVIAGVRLDPTGAQHFAKVGTRNAMVISLCSVAGRLDRSAGVARLAIGSSAPTVRRVGAAEELLLAGAPAEEVGIALAAGASTIDDHRSTAAYRRHSLTVLGVRIARWLRADDRG